MYENLKSLGIQEPTSVDSYTLRQEANHDILKIYFKKQKGEFFAKSVKFKYPRQRKTMLVDSGTHEYKDVTEINANLKYVVDELDNEVADGVAGELIVYAEEPLAFAIGYFGEAE